MLLVAVIVTVPDMFSAVCGALMVTDTGPTEVRLVGLTEQVTPGRLLETLQLRFIVRPVACDKPPIGMTVSGFEVVPPLVTVRLEDKVLI